MSARQNGFRAAMPAIRRSVGLSALAFCLSPTAAAPAKAATFWDRWLTAREQLSRRPVETREFADSLAARDSDDVLARWLTGTLGARDSTVGDSALGKDGSRPGAGDWIERGAFLLARGRPDDARVAFEHARAAYDSLGRPADASRAALWRAQRAPERGDRAASEADLELAEKLARRSGDPGALADVLVFRGERDMRRSVGAARPRFEEAIALLALLPPGGQHVAAHRNLAGALNRIGDLDGAELHYREAQRLAAAQADSAQAIRSLAGVGLVRRAQGRYPEAVSIARDVLAQSIALGAPTLVANGWHDLGTATEESGHHVEAREAFLEGAQVLGRMPRPPDNLAVSLDALGGVEITLGLHDEARAHLERAATLCRERGLASTHCFVLLHLADLHRELGDPAAASAYADEGLAVARRAGVERVESVLLALRARLYNLLDRPDSALVVARRGQALARRVERRNLWRLAQDEAEALRRLGRTMEALGALDSAESLIGEVPDSSQLGHVRLLRCRLLLARGDVSAALDAARSGHSIAVSLESPGRIADARLVMGDALLAAGRLIEAASHLDAGLAWFESIQHALRASEERSAYQARWYDGYVSLALAQTRAGRAERAFATLERSRARELRRQVAAQIRSRRAGVPSGVARELDAIEAALAREQGRLLAQYALAAGRRDPALPAMELHVDAIRTAWSLANRRAERAAPRWAREAGLGPANSASTLRRSLGGAGVVLAYLVGAERTLAFVVREDGIHVRELAWGEDSLTRAVEAHVVCMRRVERAADCAIDTLSRALLPEQARLVNAGALFILPDGPLNQLPFETLAWKGAPLIASFEVAYAAAPAMLLEPARSPAGPATLVAFGDPELPSGSAAAAEARGASPALARLPYAEREVRTIGALLPGARVFTGAAATEARFFQEAERAGRLHVAAHALLDDLRPEFSGLVLARGDTAAANPGEADGLVQAWEIAEHKIPARLVTLSACETAGGRVARGEGMQGLARAFRIAGAREMVVSLWQVGDAAAADLMQRFYAGLARGQRPAQALRAAKLAGMAGATLAGADGDARGVASVPAGGPARPRAWAAFVLIGTLDAASR